MRVLSLCAAVLIGSLAFAQMRTAAPTTTTTQPQTYTTPSTTGGMMVQGYSMQMSPDTAALINEQRLTRAEIRAAALEMRGQMLTDRMQELSANETAFRQQLAANPNWPEARFMSVQLQQQAQSLNQDIAAFNRELSMIPLDQRPYLAQRLNTFDVVYWQPALQRFAAYNTQFQQTASTAYQPAVAANPWLTSWQTSYQASLNNIADTPQTFASARWWTTTSPTGTAVLGTQETFPQGNGGMQGMSPMTMQPGSAIVLPAGTVIMIPQASTMGTTGTTGTTSTTGTMAH